MLLAIVFALVVGVGARGDAGLPRGHRWGSGPDAAQPAPPARRAVPTDARPVYAPPTDAPVTDPFRPPPQPWLPGNRGIEYGTTPGSPVRAIGPGVVAFAGQVAGRLVVSVDHPDGLRSSYTGLAGIAVRAGQRVGGGTIVGLAADRLHLGVRRGDTYLDPASLWGRTVGGGRVHLVPTGPASTGTDVAPAPDPVRRASSAVAPRRWW